MEGKTWLCLDCRASLVNIYRNQHCWQKRSLQKAWGSRLSAKTREEQTLQTGCSEPYRRRELTSSLRDGLRPAGKPHADSLNIRCLQGACQEWDHNFILAKSSDKFLQVPPRIQCGWWKESPICFTHQTARQFWHLAERVDAWRDSYPARQRAIAMLYGEGARHAAGHGQCIVEDRKGLCISSRLSTSCKRHNRGARLTHTGSLGDSIASFDARMPTWSRVSHQWWTMLQYKRVPNIAWEIQI